MCAVSGSKTTMAAPPNTMAYLVFAWLLGLCYGFVLLSSAAGAADARLFEVGRYWTYRLRSAVTLTERRSPSAGGAACALTADVVVAAVAEEDGGTKYLKLELRAPQVRLSTASANVPLAAAPTYALWRRGRVEAVLAPPDAPPAALNVLKGVASLLQFQLADADGVVETDAAGTCKATYAWAGATTFQKTQHDCAPPAARLDAVLGVGARSLRHTNYTLSADGTHLKHVDAREHHEFAIAFREELGVAVAASQELELAAVGQLPAPAEAAGLRARLERLGYREQSLLAQREPPAAGGRMGLVAAVGAARDALHTASVGTVASARAFQRLVEPTRRATKGEIAKVLDSKKNKKILLQLYDLLGCVQTHDSHAEAMKRLYFDREEHLDASERYLWALSVAPHPNPDVVADLLQRHKKNDNFPDKLKETLLLSVAAMAHHLAPPAKIARSVEEAILNGLDYAKGENRFMYLRALGNLRSPTTIPTLLQVVDDGPAQETVLALKALKALGSEHWGGRVGAAARRVFFQIGRRYDSSSRTLAADLLLEGTAVPPAVLADLLAHLRADDPSYEVKQYVYQQMVRMSEERPEFGARVDALIRADPRLNNWSTLAPRGLSTAMRRRFLGGPAAGGSLVTVQEIFRGVAKRGIVSVVLDKGNATKEMFSLGVFSGGLGGLLAGGGDGDEPEEGAATAGMELAVMGAQVRPFVFFSGQGELMGHVWSGTASERTTAIQMLALAQDHRTALRLRAGLVVDVDVKVAVSFDLAGKIEISLWNRNAESLVEKSAGIAVSGALSLDTSFVRTQIEFVASIEPRLSLKSDIDFSSNVNLCMRLTQPEVVFRYNVSQSESIPGTKHQQKVARYKRRTIPGTTYSLNRKNNLMCSAMFNEL